jgi:hypothetical protein
MLLVRLMCRELGIYFTLAKRMNDPGLKPEADPEPIQGIDFGSALATVRLFFSLALGSGAIPDLAPGHSPIAGSILEFLGMDDFTDAAERNATSISTVSECVASSRNASQFWNFREPSQIEATFGGAYRKVSKLQLTICGFSPLIFRFGDNVSQRAGRQRLGTWIAPFIPGRCTYEQCDSVLIWVVFRPWTVLPDCFDQVPLDSAHWRTSSWIWSAITW